jgi:hypothetical protein
LGSDARGAILRRMKTKRLIAAVLWFFSGWYAWNFLAVAFALPVLLGPVAGVALAAAIVWLPAQRWTVSTAPATVTVAAPAES